MATESQLPEPGSGAPYPPYVVTEAERERWDLAVAIAKALFADPSRSSGGDVWLASRALYASDLPVRGRER